jgi:hypothetical protein
MTKTVDEHTFVPKGCAEINQNWHKAGTFAPVFPGEAGGRRAGGDLNLARKRPSDRRMPTDFKGQSADYVDGDFRPSGQSDQQANVIGLAREDCDRRLLADLLGRRDNLGVDLGVQLGDALLRGSASLVQQFARACCDLDGERNIR